jgi:uridine kinase
MRCKRILQILTNDRQACHPDIFFVSLIYSLGNAIFTKTIVVIIGFCGGTGAGKSTLVKYAAQFLGANDTLILAQDHYYKHLPNFSFEQRCQINFDHPEALDFDQMTFDVSKLKQGTSISRPVYSFAEHLRMKETIRCIPKKYILVEGILVFVHEPLRSLFDYTVYIEASKDIRVKRRVERDVSSRGRTAKEVHHRFKTTLHNMHDRFIASNKEKADIVITNNLNIANATGALTQWLEKIIE